MRHAMKNLIKTAIIGAGLLVSTSALAHPDGATPYFYPSSFVFGFIEGCWETIEQSEAPITQELWPDQIKVVCGCVVDALRHSVEFSKVRDNYMDPGIQLIVTATFPVCVHEQDFLSLNEQ